MDLSEIMEDEELGAEPFVIKQGTATVSAEGAASISYVAVPAVGLIQPAAEKDLQMLSEGNRTGEVLAIYSASPMTIGDQLNRQPDVIERCGKSYRVVHADDWLAAGGYNLALAQRFFP